MDIASLFVSQRKLRHPEQVPTLVKAIRAGEVIPRIRLSEGEDGIIQVDDGYHRTVAYWLAGRTFLERHEYILVQTSRARPRFGRVGDLISRVNAADGKVRRPSRSFPGHLERAGEPGVWSGRKSGHFCPLGKKTVAEDK